MCGICGVVDYSGQDLNAGTVKTMLDVMVPRGPEAAHTRALPHAHLGHRRLSIIDLSDAGDQPMTNEDGTIWVVFNGEIYNFPELRRLLLWSGHVFKSNSDTEVLLHGSEEWGVDELLTRIKGMFAIALWDTRTETLTLARDRLGKKPLYYIDAGQRLSFASDIKALWAGHSRSLTVSTEAVVRYLYWGYMPGSGTVFSDVKQMEPATVCTFSKRGLISRKYWRLSFTGKERLSLPEAMEATEAHLKRAVASRLISDVPMGAFLSGGVDSSLVVSYMSKVVRRPQTFTVVFDDAEHDERKYAGLVATRCGTAHSEIQAIVDPWTALTRLVWEFGQPFGDAAAVPTYYLARAARQYATVALTGDGGDESFAGYSHHQGRLWASLVSGLVPRSVIERVTRRFSDLSGIGIAASLRRALRYSSADAELAFSNMSTWSGQRLRSVLAPEISGLANPGVLVDDAMRRLDEFDGDNALDRALYFDFCTLLPYCYNIKLDVATMAASLEARCPFQDCDLVQFVASLSPQYKATVFSKKRLLKKLAARRLPAEAVYRAKHGFSVPMDKWFRAPGHSTLRDTLFSSAARNRGLLNFRYLERIWADHIAGVADHGTRLWLLLWLEVWFQMFVDKTRAVTDPLLETASCSLIR